MLNTALLIWAIAGPVLAGGVTWIAMRTHEAIVVNGAITGERAKQVGICAQQLKDQALTFEANTSAGIGEAGAAADAVPPTPSLRVDLVALCKKAPPGECRSAGSLP